jgi:transcriptional regulator with XRE-family HTH domain
VPPRSPDHAAFGSAIRELRAERGVSQEALALKCGLDRTYIGGIERGERNPSLTNVFKIARTLDVTPSAILARTEALLEPSSRRDRR